MFYQQLVYSPLAVCSVASTKRCTRLTRYVFWFKISWRKLDQLGRATEIASGREFPPSRILQLRPLPNLAISYWA
jgi:hypothetical protein